MIRTLLIICTILTSAPILHGQQLGRYIDIAIRNNITLKQTAFDIERQKYNVKESKAKSLPTLGFQSRYTRSGGGRAIEFATGDLVNPAYQNLNLLNGLNTNTPGFPNIPMYAEIPNQQFTFLRQEEQETKLSLVWPIINKTLNHNKRLQEEILDVEERNLQIATIDLINEVTNAYYNYLKTDQAVAIFDTSIALVQENIRTTTSLYRNERVTKDQLLAAEAQLKSIEYQQEEARNNRKSALAYFNYLLNRRYDAPIIKEELGKPIAERISVEQAIGEALKNRIELNQVDASIDIINRQARINKSQFQPTISIVADYGIQGTQYSIDRDADFYMASAVLSWNIFNKSDKIKGKAISIDKQQQQAQKKDLERKIGLQVINAYNAIQTSLKNIELVTAEESAAREAFKLVEKKYRLGRANQIEFTDARVRLTTAQQKLVITQYDYWIRKNTLDRAMGISRASRQ